MSSLLLQTVERNCYNLCMRSREEINTYMREYQRKRANILKIQGICVNCKKNKARENRVCCEDCLIKKRLNAHSKYKLGENGYHELYKKQLGCCAICKSSEKKLVIDHDHGTMKVRGLLCYGCNTAIGKLKTIINMERAIQYLSNGSLDR